MPYISKGKCVIKADTDKKVGCTKGSVKKYLAALHANINESKDDFKTDLIDKIILNKVLVFEPPLGKDDYIKNLAPILTSMNLKWFDGMPIMVGFDMGKNIYDKNREFKYFYFKKSGAPKYYKEYYWLLSAVPNDEYFTQYPHIKNDFENLEKIDGWAFINKFKDIINFDAFELYESNDGLGWVEDVINSNYTYRFSDLVFKPYNSIPGAIKARLDFPNGHHILVMGGPYMHGDGVNTFEVRRSDQNGIKGYLRKESVNQEILELQKLPPFEGDSSSQFIIERKHVLTEGRYDAITRKAVKDIMNVIIQTRGKNDELHEAVLPNAIRENEFEYSQEGLSFIIELNVHRQNIHKTDKKSNAYFVNTAIANDKENIIMMTVVIDPEWEPIIYENLFYKLQEDIRHEIEHFTQIGPNRISDRPTSRTNTATLKTVYGHHKNKTEVPALVHGFYRRAKLEKRPLDEIMIEDLDSEIERGNLSKKQAEKLLQIWIDYAKKNIPKAKYST